MSFPSLIRQTVLFGFGMQSPQSLNENPFSFGSLLLQVVTGHVCRIKTSKGSEARNVQWMMMRDHFGQQLHKTLFSSGVEINDLGGCKPLPMIRKCVINVKKSERWTPWYLIKYN
ncbi:hypothetical protein TNCV_1499481 [Trichonephila clavipes]|nr:hypothetical protein TNCV_1499481 [Trichonephila clavipes]